MQNGGRVLSIDPSEQELSVPLVVLLLALGCFSIKPCFRWLMMYHYPEFVTLYEDMKDAASAKRFYRSHQKSSWFFSVLFILYRPMTSLWYVIQRDGGGGGGTTHISDD